MLHPITTTPAVPSFWAALEFSGRPGKRGDCQGGPRPCPWLGCRWHLAWEHRAVYKLIKKGAPAEEVVAAIETMSCTCCLDLADMAGLDLGIIGQALGVSHQAINQVLSRAMRKLAPKLEGVAA